MVQIEVHNIHHHQNMFVTQFKKNNSNIRTSVVTKPNNFKKFPKYYGSVYCENVAVA